MGSIRGFGYKVSNGFLIQVYGIFTLNYVHLVYLDFVNFW